MRRLLSIVTLAMLIGVCIRPAAAQSPGQFLGTVGIEQDGGFASLVYNYPARTDNLSYAIYTYADTETDWLIFNRADSTGTTYPLVFYSQTSSGYPATGIMVGETGIGIGKAPGTGLEFFADSTNNTYDYSRLVLDNAQSQRALRRPLILRNNGPIETRYIDTSNGGDQYSFGMLNGGFQIRQTNNEKIRFVMLPNGQVDFARGNVVNMSVRPNGNMVLRGTLVQRSDRNVKQEFESVDYRDVLNRVIEMPVTTWAFKDDPAVRHMGPVAQDFAAAFSLGEDDVTIAPVDAIGVSLAAIKGLHQELNDRDQEVAQLRDQVAELTQKLAQERAERAEADALLESIVSRLEALERE